MRLREGFITHNTGTEQIMVSIGKTDFSGLVKSNKTAAFIVDCLKEETTPEEIKQKMFNKYDAPMEKISADVDLAIEKLRSIDAIEE